MAKKEKKVNYKELDVQELDQHLEKNQAELFKLKFRGATTSIKNVMQIRNIKREIARINTFKTQKRRQAV